MTLAQLLLKASSFRKDKNVELKGFDGKVKRGRTVREALLRCTGSSLSPSCYRPSRASDGQHVLPGELDHKGSDDLAATVLEADV
jgi:hypothetical protein